MSINLSSNLNKIYFYFNRKYWFKLIDFDSESNTVLMIGM